MLNTTIDRVTKRIAQRSEGTLERYRQKVQAARHSGVSRERLSCGNLAHGFAACAEPQKELLAVNRAANIGLVSAYNDMLSAHQPYFDYPEQIKRVAQQHGASCQFAGAVPAMCDGVTQGRDGMELSLMSREVVAMATAVALSHDMFDGAMMMGICDKIVPGLLMGALSFGHLPTIFVPAGPMSSGIPNAEKAKVRQQYAKGEVSKERMLEVEAASYHSAGTCTFYGTANSNQMLMEIMGLQLPGSSFVSPVSELRPLLTDLATEQLLENIENDRILAEIVGVETIVNGLIGLLSTGGSTNHLIHMVAIAAAAGIQIDWQDIAELSSAVPLLCRIYPNGSADINHFQQAGGMPFLMRELVDNGLLHNDVQTVRGESLDAYRQQPSVGPSDKIVWQPVAAESADKAVLTTVAEAFDSSGGLKLLEGNIGRSVIKLSAVAEQHHRVSAPAKVFESQQALKDAFEQGLLNSDFIAVVRYQGPQANGMPELHQLMTVLGALQDAGHKVALVTDGRMSGASGKVPAAMHMVPEALAGGVIAKIREGDLVTLDAANGQLNIEVTAEQLAERQVKHPDLVSNNTGMGRELFAPMRSLMNGAEQGATIFRW
ncbi:6-phosphogluconate dehydratase [Sinobacterium caligoides]|uniref:Phosphogluconate dehydratase n=1 Tax=Sinobacterium caligoides TaxID=933926 RepID=A0A3N2DNN6_9GAMM|nr:phosphogluconate dehydratase [Sinobacterium caligoides]ROS01421.1 6-phosphogluconate dehydratase [Sinobacterium caligoides]